MATILAGAATAVAALPTFLFLDQLRPFVVLLLRVGLLFPAPAAVVVMVTIAELR